MAVYTQVPAEALADFLGRFDVGTLVSVKGIAEGVENSNYLVDTTDNRFILTLYEKRVAEGDLPFFMALLDHLAARGNPVPPAIPDREGRLIHELEGRPACLIRFLPGVSVTRPTPPQARAAGRAMAGMHAALADFIGERPNTLGYEAWMPLFDRCGSDLDTIDPALRPVLAAALEQVVPRWPKGGDQMVIHADLFPDNVLMRGDIVTGLIDFYFACTDLRLYDLAIMHSAWCFDPPGNHYQADVGQALIEGYAERFPLSMGERAILPTLAMGACIRFALTRAWDWLNTPADALVTRKDPRAYTRRLAFYANNGGQVFL
ncbi:homoserine kinase type II [Sphingomonas vulcanisoli]|uniref:Homoserine kinase n=1 Tax=Sphingomonas vulcanisoli TaxID=1658060 RepID=A0ABX0TN99_9SPHN|nr:homoserine kinase [Sphingomonas vulcanisoli]NIJ06991.1 homoserine kinase type II [Sphingomonas vulcanisoli]